jgi:hypothetical protein
MSERGRGPENDPLERKRSGQAVNADRPRLTFAGGGPRLWAATNATNLRTALALVFEREMEVGRGFLWLPVVFAIGILIY